MKKSYFVLSVLIVLIGVTSCEEETTSALVGSRFTHEVPNCDNTGNPEMNCVEWVEFTSGTEVSILAGGGDIVMNGNYSVNGSQIIIDLGTTSSFNISFEIIDAGSIRRIEDSSVWTKD
ncbi:hypothetical protein BFP97_05770 [Roseivirga sp. 4D4]|uniref:hypothetical protein n=1 Tax=Roseivirga sp. 4D4 TaxID=1889784 RepID=UPI0008531B0E|nr:hypothetical protein [Roseivirga sp. 4D4]OEK01044.1 hypothetical protein BFP97_05770 [Roseivirga sp. 4D4]